MAKYNLDDLRRQRAQREQEESPEESPEDREPELHRLDQMLPNRGTNFDQDGQRPVVRQMRQR